jgi:aspartate dehydrogenase
MSRRPDWRISRLVSILVRRRATSRLTHEPDRFFARIFDAVAECAGHDARRTHGQRVC